MRLSKLSEYVSDFNQEGEANGEIDVSGNFETNIESCR
jgi:hypothetical protein